MSDPWAEFTPVQQAKPAAPAGLPDPWTEFTPAQPAQPAPPAYSGSILPFSRDAQGNVSFDSNAGILGTLKRAFTAPGDAYTGQLQVRDPATGQLTPEAIDRGLEMGATFGPVNPAVQAGDRAIPGVLMGRREQAPVPTADALKDAASAGYDAARNLGVDYSSGSVARMATGLRQGLEQDGILAELAPKTFSILQKLQSPPEGSVAPLAGIEAARRALRNAGQDFANPTEQLAAKRLLEGLDRFVMEPDPSSVVAGPAAEAGRLFNEARGNYAAAKRSDRITGIEEAADLRAAAANSGSNGDNAIRQRVASLLLSPKQSAGFSDAEIAALEGVAKGSVGRNITRYVGNLLGGGGGLGAVVTGGAGGAAGGMLGDPALAAALGAGLPLAGFGAKQAANRMTARALSSADEMVRSRSPLADELAALAPYRTMNPTRSALIAQALLAYRPERGY